MPWLQSQIQDPAGHWLWFPNAVASTPLCCPSRSTILTGRYDTHTHVRDNTQGPNLDDTNTLPVWLQAAGYHTGLVGKYLNAYPWGRAPFIPPGWDRWFAKQNLNESTSYYDYDVVDQGVSRHYGAMPENYATDVLAAQALRFVQDAPVDQPWFLYFSPNAPHLPWIPSPRYAGAFADVTPPIPPLAVLNDVGGKPAYVTGLPAKTETDRQGYIEADRNERAMLRSVDDAFHALVDEVAARGELDNTVIVFLTDNGYVLGLHRLDGKRFPYVDSIGLPFAIRSPWASATTLDDLVSNLDVAATIAAVAGVQPGLPQDGVSLLPALQGTSLAPRPGVFLDWGGDVNVPAWQGVRGRDFLYVRNADGFEELYRSTDVFQLDNRAQDPAATRLLRRARAVFAALSAGAQG
jgi:arylsulfatase A-like enzyme